MAAPIERINIRRSRLLNVCMVQNFLLVWLDANVDETNNDCRDTITKLRQVANAVNTFGDVDECVDFITDIKEEKVLMIVSGGLGQTTIPMVHDMSQLIAVYILCGNEARHKQWAKEWPKIKGVFTDVSSICEALKHAAHQCEQNAISMSFMAISGDASKKNLDQLDSSYMYTQILKEILLTIKFEQQHITEFTQYCRDVLADNDRELENVIKLERKYRDETPIWWYTYECFLYPMLNRALRLTDVDIVIKMGFFIGDLHRHIEQLHKEQFADPRSNKSFTVYRGQGMSKTDFEQLTRTRGGLISFNNFLSTSKTRDVSLLFAESISYNPDLVGIVFVMAIDPSRSTTPFASIIHVSSFKNEDEVLFAMNTVFRVCDIKRMTENHCLFHVELALTSDNDKDLRILTNRIREETFPDNEGWKRLGAVLLKMGQSGKAQQVYEVMLEQTTNEAEKGSIYNQLGRTKYEQGEYQEAIAFYEKSLNIYQNTLPPNHPLLAASYNNIGLVYMNVGEYSKALSYYEKAFEIYQNTLPANHPNLATSYNNIGLMYGNMGEYSKALSYYEKALEIRQKTLPANHPSLATSYNNIGSVYDKMSEYSKALSYYEKAHEIYQKTLPANHPHLAMSYNNIGSVYGNMSEYSRALSYHEQALEIRQRTLPSNHPDLAASYNNIGGVYDSMGDHQKALSFLERALNIKQQSLPPNHPNLASSYSNVGLLYHKMSEYSKALSSLKKAVNIYGITLPSNHPNLAIAYNNIGLVYDNMGEYSEALSFHQKALEIRQETLPSNHPDLAITYNNIGLIYDKLDDCSQALSYHEKALEIYQKTLPSNHPDLAACYNNIGEVYFKTEDYSEALSFYKRALDIQQHSLPSNHANMQTVRENIDKVKKKL